MKNIIVILIVSISVSGCIATKIISSPLRLTGSIVSIIPVVGEGADSVLNYTADAVDVAGIVLD